MHKSSASSFFIAMGILSQNKNHIWKSRNLVVANAEPEYLLIFFRKIFGWPVFTIGAFHMQEIIVLAWKKSPKVIPFLYYKTWRNQLARQCHSPELGHSFVQFVPSHSFPIRISYRWRALVIMVTKLYQYLPKYRKNKMQKRIQKKKTKRKERIELLMNPIPDCSVGNCVCTLVSHSTPTLADYLYIWSYIIYIILCVCVCSFIRKLQWKFHAPENVHWTQYTKANNKM